VPDFSVFISVLGMMKYLACMCKRRKEGNKREEYNKKDREMREEDIEEPSNFQFV